MNYSEFNINQEPLVIRCVECGMPSNNHNAYHMFNAGYNFKRLNETKKR